MCGYVTLGHLLKFEFVRTPNGDLTVKIFTLLAFFCLSFTSNVLCSGTLLGLFYTDARGALQRPSFMADFSSVLIIWRVFRNADQYTPPSTRLKRFGRVVEAIVQSAAIYSMASLSLIITNFESIDIGFEACLSIFPPLIVSARRISVASQTLQPCFTGPRILLHSPTNGQELCRRRSQAHFTHMEQQGRQVLRRNSSDPSYECTATQTSHPPCHILPFNARFPGGRAGDG